MKLISILFAIMTYNFANATPEFPVFFDCVGKTNIGTKINVSVCYDDQDVDPTGDVTVSPMVPCSDDAVITIKKTTADGKVTTEQIAHGKASYIAGTDDSSVYFVTEAASAEEDDHTDSPHRFLRASFYNPDNSPFDTLEFNLNKPGWNNWSFQNAQCTFAD